MARASKGYSHTALRAAFDAAPLRGAGRAEDTFNLLGHAVREVLRTVVVRPARTESPSGESAELTALLTRRRKLVEMLSAERNRLGIMRIGSVRADIEAHAEWLEQRLKEVDKDLNKMLRASVVWREKEALYRSVPGVGPVVATTLLAELPELGTAGRGLPRIEHGGTLASRWSDSG